MVVADAEFFLPTTVLLSWFVALLHMLFWHISSVVPKSFFFFLGCKEPISDHYTCFSWYTAKSQAPALEYKSTCTLRG